MLEGKKDGIGNRLWNQKFPKAL